MFHINDPGQMTPEERFEEIAVILAKGFLRLKKRQRSLPETQKQEESERPSNGTMVEWLAALTDKKYLKYICQDGDLDQKGTYKIQPKLTVNNWSGLGETVCFHVNAEWS